jgi:hypothetical protein
MRYLNLLEDQLVAASRELSGAPAGSTRRVRSRLHAIARRHTYVSAVLALATVVAASGAIAEASGLLGPPDLSAPSPLGVAQSIPGGLASSFAILRRAPQPADALPAGTTLTAVAGGVGSHYGINIELSRFVGTVDGTAIWLVAGSTGTCMYTAHDGGVCAANDLVSSQGLLGAQVPVADGADTFIGVVPDGASVTATNTDGTPGPVSRSGAAYSVSGDADLRSVTIREADGQLLTLPAPAPFSPPSSPGGGVPPSMR